MSSLESSLYDTRASKVLCSAVFVLGLDPDEARAAMREKRSVRKTILMISFGIVMENSLIMRVSRLGKRFFEILTPSNMLYTYIFFDYIPLYLSIFQESNQ